MKTFLTPDSKNFLGIALFALGSGSLMSRIDRQIFRTPPPAPPPPTREFASSFFVFGRISSIKPLRSLQIPVGCFKCSEIVFLPCDMSTDAFQRSHQVDSLSHSFHRECVVQLTSDAGENSRENLGRCTI